MCDHPRNVPDDVLTGLAANGGVCMVTFVPTFVSTAVREWGLETHDAAEVAGVDVADDAAYDAFVDERRVTHPRPSATIDDVVAHCEHVREVAGPEHIGLGGDYDGVDRLPDGLEDVTGTHACSRRWPTAGGATPSWARFTAATRCGCSPPRRSGPGRSPARACPAWHASRSWTHAAACRRRC